MTEISGASQTKDFVNFCPECGSPAVETSDQVILSGNAANIHAACKACNWVGTVSDLVAVPFTHDFTDRASMVQRMMGDLRVVLAKHCATPIGRFLLKWGFIDTETVDGAVVINRKQMARYMTVVSVSILAAVVEERLKMTAEKTNAS